MTYGEERLPGHGADIGPALPGPHQAGLEAGEEVPVLAVAILPDLLEVKAVLVMAEMLAGRMAAKAGAGGRVARACEHGGQRKGGDGSGEEGARGGHGTYEACRGREVGGLTREETHPGEIRPGGSPIAVCLHVAVRDVADVDVPRVVRAPHPARRRATEVEVAVVTVVVVAVVVVVTVVVVAMVVMAVVVMAVVVMTMMAMAMTAAVPAAGRRVARGGEGRNSQHEGSGSGGEDSTLHFRLLLG